MANQEIQKTQDQYQGLENLSPLEEDICSEIVKINMLRDFPLQDTEIIDWAKTIIRLMPDKKPIDVQNGIDKLILGEIYYEKGRGIQNLVYAMKVIDGTDFLDRL